ncbi:MAG: DNA topoisomerase VI subunit B [Phycisphaerae bacterium]|nr:DNA topoisomerase VI subunit B [Phycisphaerae bacterium]
MEALLMKPGALSDAVERTRSTAGRPTSRVTAETLATKQRDISVSEFFAKNRHLLGFDNPRKALLTAVKEAVDNSLDACEEAGILPEIVVVIEDIEEVGKAPKPITGKDANDAGRKSKAPKASRYRITVVDNGPGILRKQVENVFGRLLFGSKFHRLKMSRGQQGIGISAAGMYGLITTGKPMLIQTRPKPGAPAHHIELAMNTKTNRAEVTVDEETEDFPLGRLRALTQGTRRLSEGGAFLGSSAFPTGTSVSIELEGRYQKGRGSVDEFLELTAIANPHARIVFVPPSRVSIEEDESLISAAPRRVTQSEASASDGPVGAGGSGTSSPTTPDASAQTTETDGVILFPRGVSELPPETKEIQPHPRGVELGTLLQMLKDYEASEKSGTLYHFLQDRFCRVSAATAGSFCEAVGLTSRSRASAVEPAHAEALYNAFQEARLAPPPTDCLAPIGVRQLLAGLLKGVRAEFYAASSREAAVYRGRPFQIEAAIAFGGGLAGDEPSRVIRFANRVPLLFQQSACASFRSVTETNWRNYDLQQPRDGLPVGPLVILLHMASVWVPFTSESKEAIADYDEIRKEMKLALMECGRKLGAYLKKRAQMRREGERRDVFQKYIGEIAKACHAITGADAKRLFEALAEQARKKTAVADLRLDEDGKRIREENPADQDGVIIVEQPPPAPDERSAFAHTRAEAAALKVASLRSDDDQPRLIDTDAPGRLNRKGRPPGGRTSTGAAPISPANRPSVGTNRQPSKSPISGAKGRETDPRQAPSPSTNKRPSSIPRPVAPPSSVPSTGSAPTSDPTNRAPKPRMRLVNGKLVPIEDGPGLF